MNHTLRISLGMLLLALVMPVLSAKELRILAIGNSFSRDAIEQNLHELAAADGHTAIIGNLFIGGCSLEFHLYNARGDKLNCDGYHLDLTLQPSAICGKILNFVVTLRHGV